MNPGRKIQQRFIIEELAGKGNTSSVFVVTDLESHGNRYILKEIVDNSQKPADKNVLEFMFQKEIELLKNINHPSIAKIFTGFKELSRYYLLCEKITGSRLDKIVEERRYEPFNEDELCNFMFQLIDILLYLNSAIEKSHVFRDLKPSNLMVTPAGRLILVDYGISKLFNTCDKIYFYSIGFNSPKTVKTGVYNEEDDVFAVGALIYYMATGKTPGLLPGGIPPANQFNSKMHSDFVKLLEKCTASPEKRISTLKELKDKLKKTCDRIAKAREREKELIQKEHISKLSKRWNLRITLIILFIVAAIIPVSLNIWHKIQFEICIKNCRRIENALQVYADDNDGFYPPALSRLETKYIKKIPSCPAGGKDTYSSSYKAYNYPGINYCRFSCKGVNHAGADAAVNLPYYNSFDGVITQAQEVVRSPLEAFLEAYRLDEEGKSDEALLKLRDLTMIDQNTLKERAKIDKYVIFWNMARILKKQNKKREAMEKYKTAARLLLKENTINFNKEAVFLLIEDLRQMGHDKYALHFYNTLTNKYVMERETPDVKTVSQMTDIYLEMGLKNEAVKLLRLYYNKAPEAEKLFLSGEIHRIEGRREEASRYYNRYLNRQDSAQMRDKAKKYKEN